jgi:hypothetical protein
MLTTILALVTGAAGTVDVYLVRDVDTEPCDAACWKSVERRAKGRAGVRKVALEDGAARLTVASKGVKVSKLASGLDGFKTEMRAGYTGAEVRIDPDAFFPPIVRPEADMVVLPLGNEIKTIVEESLGVILQQRMKCNGQLQTPQSGEVFLSRFEQDGTPPNTYLPFVATPDFNGDGKPDLYMRLDGMPEMIFMGKPGSLRLVTLGKRDPEQLVRCDLNPETFVRVVRKKNVRCADSEEHPKGDAIERVVWNQSSQLLFFNGQSFVTCLPQSSGSEVEQGFEKENKKVKLFKQGQEQR